MVKKLITKSIILPFIIIMFASTSVFAYTNYHKRYIKTPVELSDLLFNQANIQNEINQFGTCLMKEKNNTNYESIIRIQSALNIIYPYKIAKFKVIKTQVNCKELNEEIANKFKSKKEYFNYFLSEYDYRAYQELKMIFSKNTNISADIIKS